jgi:hypothetical protein
MWPTATKIVLVYVLALILSIPAAHATLTQVTIAAPKPIQMGNATRVYMGIANPPTLAFLLSVRRR